MYEEPPKPEKQEFDSDQIDEFKEAFVLFDRDNDNLINYKEFSTIMRVFGQQYGDLDLSDMFSEVDQADSGVISFQQLIKIMEYYYKSEISEEDLVQAFRAFDKEGTRQLEKMDLKDIMMNYGDKMSEDDFLDFWGTADMDRTGIVKYEELANLIFTFISSD